MTAKSTVVWWCVATVAVAILTLCLALVLGGGAPPPTPAGLTSTGRLPAWIGEIVGVVVLVLGVVTVGCGLLASGVLGPPVSVLRVGAGSLAVQWAATTVVQIGLVGWEYRGRAELLDITRAQALLVQLGLVVVAAAWFGVQRRAWCSAVGLAFAAAALLPTVVVGHARTAQHATLATIGISVHVVSAALWVGGLAGLAWAATGARTTIAWHTLIGRYSRLAFICVCALAVSGVAVSLGPLDDISHLLTSRYGAIVLFKAILLIGLGGAGWLQRRLIAGTATFWRRPFLTVALHELIVMSVAFGLAAALSRTPPPV